MKPRIYVLALCITLTACALLLANKTAEMNKVMSEENNRLKWQMEALTSNNEEIKQEQEKQVEILAERLNKLQEQVDRKQDKVDRGTGRGTRRVMEVTAYDLSVESCGKLPSHPEYGITASGKKVKEWHTIAAGKELPFGTKIYIPYFKDKKNGGIFTVEDRGGGVKNGRLDVFIADNAECFEFGRRDLEVWILE